LKELDAQLAEARSDLRTIKSRLAPTINLGSYVGGVGPGLNELSSVFQAGVRVRVDLLNQLGIDAIGRIRSQKAKIEQKTIEIETKLAESQRQTLESFQRVQLLKQQRELLESKLIANQEAYRIAKLRQASQVGIYLEVSQTLNDLVGTQSEFVTTLMQYNTAQADLLFQMGELTPAILLGLTSQSASTPLPTLKQTP
jgi:outer membrane protein TolC